MTICKRLPLFALSFCLYNPKTSHLQLFVQYRFTFGPIGPKSPKKSELKRDPSGFEPFVSPPPHKKNAYPMPGLERSSIPVQNLPGSLVKVRFDKPALVY